MNELLKTPIGRFRIIAFTEGVSYILLLFIAVPLKRFAAIPEPVKYLGWAHGLLFILFISALLQVMYTLKWSIWKGAIAMIASLIPFGTFVLDSKMLKEESSDTL